MTETTISAAVATITTSDGNQIDLDVREDADAYFYASADEADAMRYATTGAVLAAIAAQYTGAEWSLVWNS